MIGDYVSSIKTSEETEKRLNNIMQFVEAAIIVGGYGYDYKKL